MHGLSSKRRRSFRERLLLRDGPFCQLCGRAGRTDGDTNHPDYLTLGHIHSRANGGPTAFDNFQLEHRLCNEERKHLNLHEFRRLEATEA